MAKKKVIIVDDSLLMRQILSEILNKDDALEVVATAVDPLDAREKIKIYNPDVITLDVEMPKMDGVAFLEKIMALRPMPVVMISTLTQRGADITIKALEIGAVDYIGKPSHDLSKEGMRKLGNAIVAKVKMAANANVRANTSTPSSEAVSLVDKKLTKDIIAMGASTGGVEALKTVLTKLPKGLPPIVIVQHMPAGFTASFAARLDMQCQPRCVEANNGIILKNSHIYIAPGDRQMRVVKKASGYVLSVAEGEKVSGHCPSVDVLFTSVSEYFNKNALGVILTGMGKDGAQGLLAMKQNGATTLGQDAHSCVVYGMPKEAHQMGAVDKQFPLHMVAKHIVETCVS